VSGDAAGRSFAVEHEHVPPRARQLRRGGEPGGTTSDDDHLGPHVGHGVPRTWSSRMRPTSAPQ